MGPIATYRGVLNNLLKNGIEMDSSSVHHFDTRGDEKYRVKEFIGLKYSISDMDVSEAEAMLHICGIPVNWARAEFESRVAEQPENPGTAYKENEEFWKKMLEPDGKFSYTYGMRMRRFGELVGCLELSPTTDQIECVVETLKRDPGSRQAMITIWDSSVDQKNAKDKRRVPCTIDYQFFIREGKLHVCYHSRASDAVRLLASDIYQCIRLTQHIADQLGIKTGTMTHFVGSIHVFAKDWERGKEIVEALKPKPVEEKLPELVATDGASYSQNSIKFVNPEVRVA